MSSLKFSIRQKNEVLEDTLVSKTKVFTRSKHLKVFDNSLFLETKSILEILSKYFVAKRSRNFELVLHDGF
jgi:hypothetical protein